MNTYHNIKDARDEILQNEYEQALRTADNLYKDKSFKVFSPKSMPNSSYEPNDEQEKRSFINGLNNLNLYFSGKLD